MTTPQDRFTQSVERFQAIERGSVAPTEGEQLAMRSSTHRNAAGSLSGGTIIPRTAAPATNAPVPQPTAEEKIAAFDGELRAAGLQRTDVPSPGVIDERGIEACIQWRKDNPNPTPEQRAILESDLQSFYAGRRFGEKLADFRARQAAERATNARSVDPGESETMFIAPSQFPEEHLHGYDIASAIPPGVQVDAVQAASMLAAAKAAGVTQEQVTAFVRFQIGQFE
jgi:hypothetical protein